jgi:hypothetical protein
MACAGAIVGLWHINTTWMAVKLLGCSEVEGIQLRPMLEPLRKVGLSVRKWVVKREELS